MAVKAAFRRPDIHPNGVQLPITTFFFENSLNRIVEIFVNCLKNVWIALRVSLTAVACT